MANEFHDIIEDAQAEERRRYGRYLDRLRDVLPRAAYIGAIRARIDALLSIPHLPRAHSFNVLEYLLDRLTIEACAEGNDFPLQLIPIDDAIGGAVPSGKGASDGLIFGRGEAE